MNSLDPLYPPGMQVMWALITLRKPPTPPRRIAYPAVGPPWWPAGTLGYGDGLLGIYNGINGGATPAVQTHAVALRHLVANCLTEVPALRPTIAVLRAQIAPNLPPNVVITPADQAWAKSFFT